ncbi:hypothetical protein EUX98_g319 [Antrodiella citrinella]|uniref:Mitochondrial cytochrome c oxidase assembly factor n=1 Tax=Antrodiella citrinella TaxID=2447956 RepID=A0A4S4N4M6_9APHY|nr:hypothetical protein EUX98_g319 [Antrodiella citrinella]
MSGAMSAILNRLRGSNLEVFKFSFYLTFPLTLMMYFGDPEWYQKHVTPYKDHIFPPEERTVRSLPHDQASLREELAKIRAKKLERAAERLEAEKAGTTPSSSSS